MKSGFPYKEFEVRKERFKGTRVLIITSSQPELIEQYVKELPGARWSAEAEAWLIPDITINRKMFHFSEERDHFVDCSDLNEGNAKALQLMVSHLRMKAFSHNTIKTYAGEFRQLLILLGRGSVNQLTPARILDYFVYCLDVLKLSENTVHSRINAVKYYFQKVLNRPEVFADLPRPKKVQRLPRVISIQELRLLLDVVPNLKHNTMLRICYGMGLRVSELIGLRITDINSRSMQVLISRAKGKKDRYVTLPRSILQQLRTYYKAYQPKEYLFEGLSGQQYSARSAQQVFQSAMKKAGIDVQVGIHGLRHSYATHLLEQGTDIRLIKELLGHQDIRTTMHYTHVSPSSLKNIISPLDRL